MENEPIPRKVSDVLKSATIGYLTTISKKGELYSYPVAFYYSDLRIYFVTPVSAAKYKMIKGNPTVSLIVDNKQLTTNACGAMIQGRAKTYSVSKTILSILSLGPKVAAFSKKYPGMLSFYAKGKELPDERKLYKYRIIQIIPTKILYWIGYTFGRYVPKKGNTIGNRLGIGKDERDSKAMAQLLLSADEEPSSSAGGPLDHDWLVRLDEQVSSGSLTEAERALISAYKRPSLSSSKLTKAEKDLVEKWRRRS